jgi:hypothetical protein
MLLFRQRDAERLDAMMLCRPQDQAAPAAADVEEAFAGPQVELATNVFEFLLLCEIQRIIGFLK